MTFRDIARLPVLVLVVLFIQFLMCPMSVVAQDCPSKKGDCLEAHGGAGCTDENCCALICALDPQCCFDWDQACVAQADSLCSSLCGATAAGNCFTPNPTPSCSSLECCEIVCTVDPICCQIAWDGNCALIASFSCEEDNEGTCGDPNSGDCNEANDLPACNDEACCTSVCELDPSCCSTAWDLICAALANTICNSSCQLVPPFNTILESETCASEINDPCDGGESQPFTCNSSIAGKFRVATDIDAYQFEAVDTDGDGSVRINIGFSSTATATVHVLTDPCDPTTSILSIEANACLESNEIVCIPSGTTYLVIESNVTFPPCTDNYHYLLNLECLDYCGDPCENPMDCLLPHESPGCNDPTCCSLVCETSPYCCQWHWDSTCSKLAANLCGGPPPENDLCENATPALTGATSFRQSLSTVDTIEPNSCIGGKTQTSGDVWFTHLVRCESDLLIGTCSTIDFDSIVEVFRGTCGDLELISCSDDTPACTTGTSLVQVEDPICGETLLIRVSGKGSSIGTGELTIACFASECPCIADFNNDKVVNGEDMGLFLVAWNTDDPLIDLDKSGFVDGQDLGLLLANWGSCF